MAREVFQNLSEPMYLILLGLLEPLHGYALMQYIDKVTKQRVRVGAGTMYGLLAKFEDAMWISCIGNEDNRKTYQITQLGLDGLRSEQQRLTAMAKLGETLLGGRDHVADSN